MVPSHEGIHCLESSKGWRMSITSYMELTKIPSWNSFMLALFNLSHDFLDEYLFELLTLNGEDRYKSLLEKYPSEILDKIPLKYLASSIGVEPESLSRIRRKLNKAKD